MEYPEFSHDTEEESTVRAGGTPRSRKSRTLRWCAPVAVLPLLVAGCVSEDDGDSPGEGGSPPEVPAGEGDVTDDALASSVTTSAISAPGLRIDIYSLERVSDDMVVLNLGLYNDGPDSVSVAHLLSQSDNSNTAHMVNLVDVGNMQQYYALENTEGICYCGTWNEDSLPVGEAITTWVAFPAPPDNVGEISVHTPVTSPFLDIPISDGDGSDLPDEDLADPVVLDLHNLTEDLNDGTGRDETGNSVAISLDADVLFDIDESTLTGEAQEILEEVADEIDGSEATAIQIDGYTDSTGNDAINQPLSEDRADAVREQLEDLVTRSGVSYETEGHGSSDPIGDNSTEEGRQQNRRVTVTIAG